MASLCSLSPVRKPDVVPSKNPSDPSQNISEAQEGNSPEFGTHWHCDFVNYNLDVIMLGPGKGFGYIKFRQHKNESQMIYLDTWVVGLQPNTNYQLQRAVDTVLDGNSTNTSWLTLGKGLSTIYCHKQLGFRSRRIVSQCDGNSSRF